MLILLSPAKNLDFSPPSFSIEATMPRMEAQTKTLSKITAKLSRTDIARLMDLSDKLADLNWHRFQALKKPQTEMEKLQAVLAFNGDVYQGLGARELDEDSLNWAQDHLRILSGLYGLLRPLDTIAPYRLEMGTRLANKQGPHLYAFWGSTISKALNGDLAQNNAQDVINLASTEYFSAVDRKTLKARVINCHFKEEKDGQARVLSFYAKAARGMMARFAIDHRIDKPDGLKAFNAGNYQFEPSLSGENDWVFMRPQPDPKSS